MHHVFIYQYQVFTEQKLPTVAMDAYTTPLYSPAAQVDSLGGFLPSYKLMYQGGLCYPSYELDTT
jgi:hypothetical protein